MSSGNVVTQEVSCNALYMQGTAHAMIRGSNIAVWFAKWYIEMGLQPMMYQYEILGGENAVRNDKQPET